MPHVMKKVAQVKAFRENSKSSQQFAATPWLFRETSIPAEYILIPKTSSERRQFFPLGFVKDVVVTNSTLYLGDATIFHFGILSSTMHNAWMRAVAGRLESRYRHSAAIVYNNFPWPFPTPTPNLATAPSATTQPPAAAPPWANPPAAGTPDAGGPDADTAAAGVPDSGAPAADALAVGVPGAGTASVGTGNLKPNQPLTLTDKAQAAIETAAQTVLDARAQFPTSSLADLYDPLTTPPALLKAHQKLDAAVDKAYEACGGPKTYKNDAERVAFLFELYQRQTSLLAVGKAAKVAHAAGGGRKKRTTEQGKTP